VTQGLCQFARLRPLDDHLVPVIQFFTGIENQLLGHQAKKDTNPNARITEGTPDSHEAVGPNAIGKQKCPNNTNDDNP